MSDTKYTRQRVRDIKQRLSTQEEKLENARVRDRARAGLLNLLSLTQNLDAHRSVSDTQEKSLLAHLQIPTRYPWELSHAECSRNGSSGHAGTCAHSMVAAAELLVQSGAAVSRGTLTPLAVTACYWLT